MGFRFRKVADKSNGRNVDGSWPLDHVEFDGEPPQSANISTRVVLRGMQEGWITGTGETTVVRPAGPANFPYQKTHTFWHYKSLMICGVKYNVVHQPDKYAADGDDSTPVTEDVYAAGSTRVDNFYGVVKASG